MPTPPQRDTSNSSACPVDSGRTASSGSSASGAQGPPALTWPLGTVWQVSACLVRLFPVASTVRDPGDGPREATTATRLHSMSKGQRAESLLRCHVLPQDSVTRVCLPHRAFRPAGTGGEGLTTQQSEPSSPHTRTWQLPTNARSQSCSNTVRTTFLLCINGLTFPYYGLRKQGGFQTCEEVVRYSSDKYVPSSALLFILSKGGGLCVATGGLGEPQRQVRFKTHCQFFQVWISGLDFGQAHRHC